MYRVMIIDDEKSIRSLLKASVDWEKLGLKVVGEAESGIDAINNIDKFQPHIVFVDIRMPFMDGIEFSKIALERYPSLRVIVLSAYDEFDYARKCIGMGVLCYLLKPIAKKEIYEALEKAVKSLDEMGSFEEEKSSNKGLPVKEADMIRIANFIKENYTDTTLNLASIAGKFGYNSSYLSRRFKELMEINISDYILKCRMEHAKRCIEEGKLMYIAAKEVGIPDPNYFGKCFRKYMGKSYSDLLKERN